MQDAQAPSTIRAFEQIAQPSVYRLVLSIAHKRTRNADDARELVEDALMRLVDPDDMPWDDTKTSFVTHMDFVMRHLWGRRRRQALQRGEKLVDGAALDEATASPEPAADDQLDLRRLVGTLRTLGAALRALAAERYPLAAQCFDLAMQGIESAREQADALGLGVERVYDAHEFLRRNAATLREDWESAEQVRMAAERARRKMREETRS